MSLVERETEPLAASTQARGHLRLVRGTTATGAAGSGPPVAAPQPLSWRAFSMLRAVAAGRAELLLSCEPDLYVDGLACCDQFTAHQLARAGLVRQAGPGLIGHRVPAVLTAAGREALNATPSLA